MKRKYTTKLLPRGFLVTICNDFGSPTGFKVLVPYSSPKRFSIGSLSFDVRLHTDGKTYAYANGSIPFNWFTNLNEG